MKSNLSSKELEENTIIIKKSHRRRTKEISHLKTFKCHICKKKYVSNSGLYLHCKYKHKIIILNKEENKFLKNLKNKQNVNDIIIEELSESEKSPDKIDKNGSLLRNLFFDNTSLFPYFIEYLKDRILKVIEFLREKLSKLNNFNIIFGENFLDNQHSFFNILDEKKNKLLQNKKNWNYKIKNLYKTNLKSNENDISENNIYKTDMVESTDFYCLDEIIVDYFVLISKSAEDETFLDTIVLFFVLFREYVNIVGWDFKMSYFNFEICEKNFKNEYYSTCNDAEDVPEFINEFFKIFFQMEIFKDFFSEYLNEKFFDIVKNFCSWLYINKYTRLRILRISE